MRGNERITTVLYPQTQNCRKEPANATPKMFICDQNLFPGLKIMKAKLGNGVEARFMSERQNG